MSRAVCLVAASFIALTLPRAASAHGLPGGDAESVLDFVWLGIRHMVGGWDHLLFIAGIVLLAREAATAAKLISAFVAGHSLTLLVATLAGWEINAEAVDAIIALSVVYIGLRNLRGRPDRWAPTALIIFAFGLAHGLGLSTRLQELNLPDGWAMVARILAFNLGVEIGQLLALGVLIAIGTLAIRLAGHVALARRAAATALVVVGALASAVLGYAAARPDDASSGTASGTCTPGPGALVFDDSGGGGHPRRAFYEPGAATPSEGDLQHVMLDGYLIVRYAEDLDAEQWQALAEWTARDGRGLVVVPTPQTKAAFSAVTTRQSLRCETLDLDALEQFRQEAFGLASN